MLFLLFWLLPSVRAIKCYSCASTELESQWQATGLPMVPRSLQFDEECETVHERMATVDCASSCMEMLVVVGHGLAVLRGCWHDFFASYSLPNIQNKCSYGDYFHDVTVPDSSGNGVTTLHQVLVGAIYCSTENCNKQISSPIENWVSAKFWNDECAGKASDTRVSDCIDCARYDDSGDCHADYRRTCSGQWCTKSVGYVNGRWLEKRGCAPFNPAGNQLCFHSDSAFEHTFLDNHPFLVSYSLETCFCEGSKCNGAPMGTPIGAIWAIVVLPLLLTVIALSTIGAYC